MRTPVVCGPVLALAVLAAGCGSGSSSSTTTTSPAPPVTTTSQTAPAPPPTTTKPKPAGPLADGVHFVILHGLEASGRGYVATVDPARYLVGSIQQRSICLAGGGTPQACAPGPEQERACEAAGGGQVDPEDGRCWNDYFVLNPVDHVVRIHVARRARLILHTDPILPTPGDLAAFVHALLQQPVPDPYNALRPPYGLLWLTVHHGVVVRLSQQFVS
jgi:hypothetical protein